MSETTGVQALFSSDAALQDAIGRLTLLGFDRADLTVPDAGLARGEAAPASEQASSSPMTETDTRQARTMATSMAATTAAIAAAGVTIATGGAAALAAGAALAVGAGAGGLASLGGTAVSQAASDQRDRAASGGGLALVVRTRAQDKVEWAEAALRDAGGHNIVRLIPAGSVASNAWTG